MLGLHSATVLGTTIGNYRLTGQLARAAMPEGGYVLVQLRSLYIENAQSITDLTPLGRLRKLRDLTLLRVRKLANLAPLSRLRQLRQLRITNWNRRAFDIKPLAKLRNLRSLDIEVRPGYAPTLARLRRLETLRLVGEVELSFVRKLRRLRSLRIGPTKTLKPLVGDRTIRTLRFRMTSWHGSHWASLPRCYECGRCGTWRYSVGVALRMVQPNGCCKGCARAVFGSPTNAELPVSASRRG